MPKMAEFLLGFHGPTAYVVVFVILLACGFGLPIPEDITLIAAGVLAYYQAANVWGMIGVGMAGVLIGDSIMFFLGRRYGLAIAKKRFIARVLSEKRLAQVAHVLNNRGNKVLFAARFMPGLRSPLFFTAGALGVPFRVFLFYDGMAAFLSVPAIIYSVYYFGSEMEKVVIAIKRANLLILAVIVLVAVVVGVKWYVRRRRQRAEAAAASLEPIANKVAFPEKETRQAGEPDALANKKSN